MKPSIKKIYDKRREKAIELYEDKYNNLIENDDNIKKIDEQINELGINILNLARDISNIDLMQLQQLEKKMNELSARKKEYILNSNSELSKLKVVYECELCNDTGVIDNEYCKCYYELEATIISEKMSNINYKKNILLNDLSLDFYKDENSQEKAKKLFDFSLALINNFDEAEENGLYICGGIGLGKTTITVAIANELRNRKKSVVYLTSHDLSGIIKNSIFNSSSSSSADAQLKNIIDCDVLLIDDLGSEFSNTPVIQGILNIINNRSNCKKYTVITSNLNIENLAKTYGDRLTSRILEYKIFQLAGQDIRKLKRINRVQNEKEEE